MNSGAYDKQKLHCLIYFSLSICTLPHLGSSFIQYHIYASALFISPKLREKRPNTKLFLVRIFLYSD